MTPFPTFQYVRKGIAQTRSFQLAIANGVFFAELRPIFVLLRSCLLIFGLLSSGEASLGFASDDMSIFSGLTQLNCNNGWQDWGWVTHYLTNNPAWNGHYTMTFA